MKLTTAGAIVAGLFIGIPLAVEHAFSEEESTTLAYAPYEELIQDDTAEESTAEESAPTAVNGDAARGKKRFGTCRACHSIRDNGKHGIGPNLLGVVDRPVASAEGFNYTPALLELGGVWSVDRLDEYLANPTAYAPGTTMVLPTAKPQDRTDIIAYLISLTAEE